MYNAISVVIFHFSWKYQSGIWGIRGQAYLSSGTFESNSVAINGWLRDFLWSQSSQVIQSYGSYAGSYGLMFLAAHFVWAFSLMFLFSGRGYWQELIESIVWCHNSTGIALRGAVIETAITHYNILLVSSLRDPCSCCANMSKAGENLCKAATIGGYTLFFPYPLSVSSLLDDGANLSSRAGGPRHAQKNLIASQ